MISPSAPPSAESSLHDHLSGRSNDHRFFMGYLEKKNKNGRMKPKKNKNFELGKWMQMDEHGPFFRENDDAFEKLKYSSFRETHWCMARTEWAEWPGLVATDITSLRWAADSSLMEELRLKLPDTT